jgi:hypothetical protein
MGYTGFSSAECGLWLYFQHLRGLKIKLQMYVFPKEDNP